MAKILTSEDSTEIFINSVFTAMINKRKYHEFILTDRSEIFTSKPVMVCQYANGTEYSGTPGDPAMNITPP